MKERAVRMAQEVADLIPLTTRCSPGDQTTGRGCRVSLRTCAKQAEIDCGSRPGVTSTEHDEPGRAA
jgi:hypothetical protein